MGLDRSTSDTATITKTQPAVNRVVGEGRASYADVDSIADGEKLLEQLQRLWIGPNAAVMSNPVDWIVENVGSTTLSPL